MKHKVINDIESILLNLPDLVNYSSESNIQAKPDLYVPIFLNLKLTLFDFKTRILISKRLAEVIGKNIDIICGVESGGTYYSSAVSDLLKKPLIFYRKKNKGYGFNKIIIGKQPSVGSNIAVIDDVMATGFASAEAVNYFQQIGCQVKVFSIFSYIPDVKMSSKLGVKVRSLSNFTKLCKIAKENKIFTEKDIETFTSHVSTYLDSKI